MKAKRSKSLSPEPSSSNEWKRPKIDESCEKNGKEIYPNLLDLSDDVLLNIMKFLHPQDLMALSLCCQRLNQVSRDRTLWRKVDFRVMPMMVEDLEKYVHFLQPLTTSLAMRGSRPLEKHGTLSKLFLKVIAKVCSQLKELIVEDYYIDANKIQIIDFPETVEKLSLKGCKLCHIQIDRSYFFTMDLHMRSLTCLILSNCQWFMPHSLLVISKIRNLKELRLDSCHSLGECVAYTSLATRFGFKTLEILDLRDTALGDSEICCFSSTKTLTHLYLECPAVLVNTESNNHLEQQQLLDRPGRRRAFEDQNLVQIIIEHGFENNSERCLISDRAICALGSYACDRRVVDNSVPGGILVEEDRRIFNNPNLKTLVVRNYPLVTNQSLVHLALNASNLEFLDVTGTAVTKAGVQTFKGKRPNVKLISSFDET
ncbi:uncharacterized protein LOC105694556 isoform X2 [Orussus abietinus]|nr:uncharacterized protein LOC105694556 isoform X2 [Orussus abietinus]